MRVGFAQTKPVFGDKEKNFRNLKDLLQDQQADLLVLPELFATGYTFTSRAEAETCAETLDDPTAAFLQEIAVSIQGLVVGGFVEREEGKIYNAALLISPDGVLGTYRKVHLFYKETLWFDPGDRVFRIFEWKGAKIGVMICFDWMFPEAARSLALLGAEIIAHPANLVMPYCQAAMTTRCLENRVFAVTANRVGREVRGDDDFTFTGGSQVTGVGGEILASAPVDVPHIDFVEIDIDNARDKQLNAYNDLVQDRRPDFYEL